MRSYTAAASLLASASVALAGSATVVNHCSFPVNLWSVGDTPGDMHTLQPGGAPYTEAFRAKADGGGISIKMTTGNDVSNNPAQFEYTATFTGQWAGLTYDISNIDGDPFHGNNVNIVPSGPGAGQSHCLEVICNAGGGCTDVYYKPDDNYAVQTCTLDNDITYNICAGSTGSSPPSSSPSPSPVASPAPAPSPSTSTAPVVKAAAASPAPASSSPAPAAAAHYPLGLQVGPNNRIVEVELKPSKREAEAEPAAHHRGNHRSRHERIRRMHHARSIGA